LPARLDATSANSLVELLLPILDATLPNPLRDRMKDVDRDRPRTLLAYINSLVRLGMRYESGDGTTKNPHQALRYYTKAAKLGSEPALMRLAAGGLIDAPHPRADDRSDDQGEAAAGPVRAMHLD
jgi:TPR repeat protein